MLELRIENLSKKFKNEIVLENVSLVLDSNKIYGFVGRNGSGKSVFLKLLLGLYIKSEGEIKLNGKIIENVYDYSPIIRAFLDNGTFINDITGLDNLLLINSISKLSSENQICKLLDEVNLLEERNKRFSKYSHGMKQKLGIACALMDDPEILLLDEPFNGIDGESVYKIKKMLLEYKSNKKLIIITSHVKDDLIGLCDEVYTFNEGTVSTYLDNSTHQKIRFD